MTGTKRLSVSILALALVCSLIFIPGASPASISAEKYETVRTYNGQFSDVKENDWFYDEVARAYSLGLINGKTDSTFVPEGQITLAEAIKLAAISHQLLTDGKVSEEKAYGAWYQVYLDYCKRNHIVTEDYPNYNAAALRCQIAVIFSRVITAAGVKAEEINTIEADALIDIEPSEWYSGAFYRMYRWGIITGSGNGKINPNSTVKRSEVAAIVMRVIDPEVRIRINEEEPEEVTPPPTVDRIVLYEGSDSSASFLGITGFAADFSSDGGAWQASKSYFLNLIDSLALEPDNISFSLYKGAGYEALGILRGWLNASARGQDGEEIRDAETVRENLNERFLLWINSRKIEISEMWYAEYSDHVTYSFYFDKHIDVRTVETVDLMCGHLGSDIMETDSLSIIRDLLNGTGDSSEDTPTPPSDDKLDIYGVAVSDIKNSAHEILFEYECSRCSIIYGRGMYGGDPGEYRLLFIFKEGSIQTVSTQRIKEIRMNQDGSVLYYTVIAPDGNEIQYGVNFE